MKVTRPLTFLTLLVIPRHTSAQGTHEVETHSGCYLPLELFESREVTLRPSVTSVTMAEVTLTAQVNLTNSALALAMKGAAARRTLHNPGSLLQSDTQGQGTHEVPSGPGDPAGGLRGHQPRPPYIRLRPPGGEGSS
nr:uncharacterized protein LOC123755363 isoform X2 [Procambarus clarkii]